MKFLRPAKRFPVEIKKGVGNSHPKGAATWYGLTTRLKYLETRKRYPALVTQVVGDLLSSTNALKFVTSDGGIGTAECNNISHGYVAPICDFEQLGIGI